MTAYGFLLLSAAIACSNGYVVTNQGTQMDQPSQSKWNNGYRGYDDNSMERTANSYFVPMNSMGNGQPPMYNNGVNSMGNGQPPMYNNGMNSMGSQPYGQPQYNVGQNSMYGQNGMNSMYQSYPRRV